MSKAEEKNIGIIKKAKEILPDGGYSEKELNLAFSMFINGYRQAEKDLALTNADVYDIWRIYNEVCAEGEINGFDETSQEVLKRFNEYRTNEQKES